jgi:tripartite-type tricarboxylate transporter receptor subunit TctC
MLLFTDVRKSTVPLPRGFAMAIDRGELDGAISAVSEIFGGTGLRVLAQFGADRNSTSKQVPTAIELAATEEARNTLNFYALKYKMARPLIMPPDVPEERVEALRHAFDAAVREQTFIEDATKLGMDVDPVGGEDLAKLIRQIRDTPQPIVDKVLAIIDSSSVN